MITVNMGLGPYRLAFEKKARDIVHERVVERIHDLDHTVWKKDPGEIANRLGWLVSPFRMRARTSELESFADEVRRAGFTDALLLGMGGSSLAPGVLSTSFGSRAGFLALTVLDSTDPLAVDESTRRLDPASTLFVVSTKSGTTTETLSFFRYCYRLCADSLGASHAGSHFVAVTDPGTPLNETARKCSFRRVFAGDPAIGGRFSALSVFGLLPAAFLGVDLNRLLDTALAQAEECRIPDIGLEGANRAAALGTALGVLARAGRDKLTLFLPQPLASFGDWVEQLVAESTGKEGTGILPVIHEAPGRVDLYGADRVFVSIHLRGSPTPSADLGRLGDIGHPIIRIFVDDMYDLGALFYLWEFATAVGGHVLGINPFDQPDVESTKIHTRQVVEEYRRTGTLEQGTPLLTDDSIEVYGSVKALTLRDALIAFLFQAREDSYVSIQAYLNPGKEVLDALDMFRTLIRDRYRLATTVGFGPRFLHSTGQLHKGDAGRGLFIQITSDSPRDIRIPDDPIEDGSSLTFHTLKKAQWLGDAQALAQKQRRVLRLHIVRGDVTAAVRRMYSALA